MNLRLIRVILLCFAFIISHNAYAYAQTVKENDSSIWLKADLHTHHTFKCSLEDTVKRYKDAGYGFVVLSAKDLDKPLRASRFSTTEMLIVDGVEQSFLTSRNLLGHIIAFPIKAPYPITSAWTLKQGYEKMRVKNRDVILGINHPHDKRWALSDVLESEKDGVRIFELNSIDMKHGEFETAQWDAALSAGAVLWAMLTNDVHQNEDVDAYGYIMLRASERTTNAALNALRKGDFYSVEAGCKAKIERFEVTDGKIEISAPGAKQIKLIKMNGVIAAEYQSESASYRIKGDEGYIRAEIIDAGGFYIFMQPFFIK